MSDPFSYSIWHKTEDPQLQLLVFQTAVTDKPASPFLLLPSQSSSLLFCVKGEMAPRCIGAPSPAPTLWPRCHLKKLSLDPWCCAAPGRGGCAPACVNKRGDKRCLQPVFFPWAQQGPALWRGKCSHQCPAWLGCSAQREGSSSCLPLKTWRLLHLHQQYPSHDSWCVCLFFF